MAHQQQNATEFPQPNRSSTAPVVLASLAIVAAAYFGFVRPAQEHMQSLERQCNKLVIAVKKTARQRRDRAPRFEADQSA